jgi:hypothetical protein
MVHERHSVDYEPPEIPDRAPLVELRRRLTEARRAGAGFEDVWATAVGVALEIAAEEERADWSMALLDTADAWQCAYERREHPALRPLETISFDRGVGVEDGLAEAA